MQRYAIRGPSASRREDAGESFEERLYRHLEAAPWWLASLATHAVAFLLLSLFLGSGSAPAAWAEPLATRIDQARVEMEEPVEVDVVRPDPPDPEPILPTAPEDLPPVPTENPPVENDDPKEDPRKSPGPFDGDLDNAGIGVGPRASGGGPPGFGPRTPNLRPPVEKRTMDATQAGLEWLRRHQGPGGAWDCDGFEARCRGNRCGGPGGPLYDPGVTGLSLLAFLGYGETHRTPQYGAVVREALKYLKGIQDAEGCFGPRTSGHFTYNHSIAALAMAEAYGATRSPLFRASAQNGIGFILQCRNPYLAWRYGVRPQDNDTSVTGWMVMALKSAVTAGLEVDPDAFRGAVAWLDKVTEPEYGRAGYTARGNGPARPQELMDRFPADRSESLTAVAVLTRIFAGASRDDAFVRKGADLCLKSLPLHDTAAGTIDHYYWYYGTLAMFQVGGDHWKRWNEAMKRAIVDTQRAEAGDDRHGSWDPLDPWAQDGGRVYSTACNVMSLQVYYRYGRVFGVR